MRGFRVLRGLGSQVLSAQRLGVKGLGLRACGAEGLRACGVEGLRSFSTPKLLNPPKKGLMQDYQLLISSALDHAEKVHSEAEIVSRAIEDPSKIHRTTWAQVSGRAKKLASALEKLGLQPSDAVASIAWNGFRHLEVYYAVSGSALILHTINPRLAPEKLAFVVNNADDKAIFVDLTFFKGIEALSPKLPTLKHIIVMTDKANMPETSLKNVMCYEELLETGSEEYIWPQFPEDTAAALCYTSGTTGDPKGVLYSHRSTMLHAWSVASRNSFNLGARDICLPVVPMFHVQAWGIPYAAAMTGCKLVFPGSAMDGPSIYELLKQEEVTLTCGVPTVWQMLMAEMESKNLTLPKLERILVGGSALPSAMLNFFEAKHGIHAQHAWGMTEMSPTGVVNCMRPGREGVNIESEVPYKMKQGREMYGVELDIFDEQGNKLPRDGVARGALKAKGPWVLAEYLDKNKSEQEAGGWFDTGDVATITPDGYMEIVDRTKDMIKSGGEWISSIELENIAQMHPGIAQAAAIGIPDEKWGERPVIVAVKKPNQEATKEQVLAVFKDKVPKWSIPEDVKFVESLPVGGTGKIMKTVLRDQFGK